MKRLNFSLMITVLLLVVMTACGQGQDPVTSEDDTNDIETDQNEELLDDEQNVEQENEEVTSHPVTLYFADDDLTNLYRVEKSIVASDEELFKATLQQWIEGPEHQQLVSLVPDTVTVQSVEDIEGVAHVSFSPELLDANLGSSGELFLLQQITLIMKQFGFPSTQILIDGTVHEELLGHVSIDTPLEAGDAEEYEWIE